MTARTFTKPGTLDTFSLASIFAEGQNRDWSDGYGEEWEIVLPTATLGDVEQYAADLLDEEEAAQAKADPYAPLSDDLADAWQQSDGRDEWRGAFDPMMNYAWPVALGFEVESQKAADLMAEFAPSCTLIERGEVGEDQTYEIALNGGGMNLSDHIAAAYMCCGAVPPVKILEQLNQSLPSSLLHKLPMRAVFEQAQDYLRNRADRLGEILVQVEEKAEA